MAFEQTIEKPGLRFEGAYVKLGGIRMSVRDVTADLTFDVYQSKDDADAYKADVLAGETPNPTDYIIEQKTVGVEPASIAAMLTDADIRASAYKYAATTPQFEDAKAV